MTALMHELNPHQQKAAHHKEGPMLVLAGAGSGKTKTIVARLLYLLEIGVPTTELLAVTFTNKAAGEMRHRIFSLSQRHIYTCTFHSLCAQILRSSIHHIGYTSHFLIADEEDREKILKQTLQTLDHKSDKETVKRWQQQIAHAKNQLLLPQAVSQESSQLKTIYQQYQSLLRQYNTVDFDDLLLLTVHLLQNHEDIRDHYQHRWRFISIDEYQDTNYAQHVLMKLLSGKHHNVFAVGDPDQSIYSWRGADIRNILQFQEDFPHAQIIKLEQNYRSTKTILEAANALIQHNEGRYQKDLWSQHEKGENIQVYIADNERLEAQFVTDTIQCLCQKNTYEYRDICLFYRTNFQSRTFEDALLKCHIPYTIIGGISFYQRKEIKDLIAFLRMLVSDCDFLSFTRTIHLPKRGFGSTTLHRIEALLRDNQTNIISLCTQMLSDPSIGSLSRKQQTGLIEYYDHIFALRTMVQQSIPLHQVLSSLIERFHYLDILKEDPDTYEEKKNNVDELIAKMLQWEEESISPSLPLFLEELTLRSTHTPQEEQENTVRLMTLHNGKGLEFPVVFLVGMEEDLFPHVNAKDNAALIEEERRLCYVGLTRARQRLFLSAARSRFLWGYPRSMRPSRFLKEIPPQYLSKISPHIDEPEHPLMQGDHVLHKDFGSGIIQKEYQTSLGTTYDVLFFDTHTTRSLVGKYAKLKKI